MDFPLDVARLIFEEAAYNDDQKHVLCNLSYVSKSVRQWVEPIAYQTLTFWDFFDLKRFISSAEIRIPMDPGFFARNVRTVCVRGVQKTPTVTPIISLCSGIHNLSAWFDWADTVPSYPYELISSLPNLKRLSTNQSPDLLNVEHIPTSITHLDFNNTMSPLVVDYTDHLDRLQKCPASLECLSYRVTSIMNSDWDNGFFPLVPLIKSILKLLPSLRRLVLNVFVLFRGSMVGGPFGLVAPQTATDTAAVAASVQDIADARFVLMCNDMELRGQVDGLICYNANRCIDTVPCWVPEIMNQREAREP